LLKFDVLAFEASRHTDYSILLRCRVRTS
jgi:hypothetical protein